MAVVKLEMQFAGVAGVWTDITNDLMDGVSLSYGITGSAMTDRTASSGSMTFRLNNSASNSGGLVGYYSIGHTNMRTGFALSNRCRLTLTDPATSTPQVRFVGSIDSIVPMAGLYREQTTEISVLDWLNDAAEAVLLDASLQVNQLSGSVVSAAIATMARQPLSTSIAAGRETFAYAFDDQQTTVLTEIARCVVSEFGWAYLKGTGQFVYEQRSDRTNGVSQATFSESMAGFEAKAAMSEIATTVTTMVNPRRAEATITVLWTSVSVIEIGAGASVVVEGNFSDPTQRAVAIGAWSLSTITATTDYLANSQADGLGSDMTASLSVVAVPQGGGSVRLTLTNAAATTMFVTFLQQRGKGLYDYGQVYGYATNAALVAIHGNRPMRIDMPYQSSADFAYDVSQYMLGMVDPAEPSTIASVTIVPATAAINTQIMTRDIGDRITITETVTGVNAVDFYINAVKMEIALTGYIVATWILTRADMSSYWSLGVAGFSELDTSTVLSL